MKTLVLLTITFISLNIAAQKVKVKDNIAYINDSAFCKIVGKATLLNPEYTIAAVNGEELIYVNENPGKDYVSLVFLNNNAKAKLAANKTGMFHKNIFIKMLFANAVIVGNEINEKGKNKLLAKYEAEEEDEKITTTQPNQNTLVERNTEAMVMIFGRTIKQDGETIGTVAIKNYADDNANLMRKYSFTLLNNKVIAELKVDEFNADKYSFITTSDNKTHSLTIKSGSFVVQENNVLVSAATYLVGLKYL